MYEQLSLRFRLPFLINELAVIQRKLGDPVMQNEAFGGYCLQSQDGDWRKGFEQAYSYRRGTNDGREVGLAPHHYYIRTEACHGYFGEVLDELQARGFHPRRARVSMVNPGTTMRWHQDAADDVYCVRLHIAIQTNADAAYETENHGSIHIPADGHAWLVDTSLMHRSVNYGSTPRWHFFCEVWDTTGYSKNFVVSESTKSLQSYYDAIGHEHFQRVKKTIDERQDES